MIVDNLHIRILPGALSLIIFLLFVGLDFDLPLLDGFEIWKLRFGVCHEKVKWIPNFDGKPALRRKTTEGLVPSGFSTVVLSNFCSSTD
jgi:hypothetical protein